MRDGSNRGVQTVIDVRAGRRGFLQLLLTVNAVITLSLMRAAAGFIHCSRPSANFKSGCACFNVKSGES